MVEEDETHLEGERVRHRGSWFWRYGSWRASASTLVSDVPDHSDGEIKFTDQDAHAVISQFDTDQNGNLSYQEFNALLDKMETDQERNVMNRVNGYKSNT